MQNATQKFDTKSYTKCYTKIRHISCTHKKIKNQELPEDRQELRPKAVGAIVNK